MPQRHLLVIPLPHGRRGRRGSLTVYFAPRLRQRGRLRDYPEWERWPDAVGALTLEVWVDGVLVPSRRVAPRADIDVWRAVFADDTPVWAHRPTDWRRIAHDRLRVVPGGNFSEHLLALYAEFAARFPAAPPVRNQADGSGEVATAIGAASTGADEVLASLAPMSSTTGEKLDEPRHPRWDFHQHLSVLGAHPELLRRLGLAVELEIELPPEPQRVRVHTDYDNGADRRAVDFSMATSSDFWALSGMAEQEDGFLRLADEGALVTLLDAEIAATRIAGITRHGDGALPGLTTRALTLVRKDLAAAFQRRTKRQWQIEEDIYAALSSGEPVDAWAEDATIGERIDVCEPGAVAPRWRSLFQRRSTAAGYHFPRDPTLDLAPQPDEGWTTMRLTTELVEVIGGPEFDPRFDPDVPNPPPRDDKLEPEAVRRVDEAHYRWDGWSGAVRPPGAALDGPTGGILPEPPNRPPPASPVQFAAEYAPVEGSLPRLRCGNEYLLRARCVDLSGVSRGIDAPVPAAALPEAAPFGRLEPVAAPTVVRRTARPVPGVGDEATTVVVRSDYDIADERVAVAERLLFPGQVGHDLCELHGLPAGGADPTSYRQLAARDARAPADAWDADPVTGEPIAAGRRRQPVEYLADPMAGRLRAYHHGEDAEYLAANDAVWPALTSARVEVVAGERSTQVDPDDSTEFRFAVAKADIDDIDLSYALVGDDAVEQFGLWHHLDPDSRAALRARIADGGHWMFSARTALRLVHAVRRPLLAPQIVTTAGVAQWRATRAPHSTGVTFSTVAEIDRRSTERLTLTAGWTDLVDDLRADAPVERAGGALLGSFATPRAVGAEPRFGVVDHYAELGDTRRHAATIGLEAFSSFSAHFTEEATITLAADPVHIDGRRRGFSGGSLVVHGAAGGRTADGRDYTADPAAGTISVVPGGQLAVGDAVVVRYVPLPVSRTSDEPGNAPFEVVLPATQAPPPPVVVDVVPAFARSRTTGKDGDETVVHRGGVLRVYFARPWNVSGDGEHVAVLVERSPSLPPAATCIGRDPIVAGATEPLTAASFPRATAVVGAPDGVHDLVVHDVVYDPESRRWSCDIAVDTTMYRPFVRLVLARYQADAIAGEELSTAVTLEPSRLGVDRTVTVRRDPSAPDLVDVTVAGVDHDGMPTDDATGSLLPNSVVVTTQRASPAIADPDLRWQADNGTVELVRSAGAPTTWSGQLTVPVDGHPRRLVIDEREPALVGGATPDVTVQSVYVEVVELPVGADE